MSGQEARDPAAPEVPETPVAPITCADTSETAVRSVTLADKSETALPITCTGGSETALPITCIGDSETLDRSKTGVGNSETVVHSETTDTSETKVPPLTCIDKSETVHSETCTDKSETILQSVDEVVENFFEGLDEDSFIAELQVVSAWGDNKNSNTFTKDQSKNKITQAIDGLQNTTEVSTSDVMSDAIKAKPKASPIPTLIRKPAKKIGKGKVSNYEKESALDRFKSFLPDSNKTDVLKVLEVFKNKQNQKVTNNVTNKIEKPESKVDLGVRRDPDKTKRDIERDKQNKNKETLIKKMETGLIPPGMEMEIDNSSTVAKRQSVKRKESVSPKHIKSQDNYKRRQDDYTPRSRYFKRSSIRTPTTSPDRNSRYDRRSSRSSRSSRPGYDRTSCERRGSDRSNAGRSPLYERRRGRRNRPDKKSLKSRASIEMELLAATPVQYPIRPPAPSVSYPPPMPVPAPSYNTPYLAVPYSVDGNSFNLETQQPMTVTDTTVNPNLSTTQDYYAPGYTQSYGTIPFNPDVLPPNAYSNGYSHVNNYAIQPPADPTYSNVGCSNYVCLLIILFNFRFFFVLKTFLFMFLGAAVEFLFSSSYCRLVYLESTFFF